MPLPSPVPVDVDTDGGNGKEGMEGDGRQLFVVNVVDSI